MYGIQVTESNVKTAESFINKNSGLDELTYLHLTHSLPGL